MSIRPTCCCNECPLLFDGFLELVTSKKTKSDIVRFGPQQTQSVAPHISASDHRTRRQVLSKDFLQEKFGVPRRILVQRTEHFVAKSLIKWPGLEAVCLEGRPDRAQRLSVGLRILHKPRSVPCTTSLFGDPQISHMQPATPQLAENPAENVAALAAQQEVDREIVGQSCSGNIEIVDAAHNELSFLFIDERLELDSNCFHYDAGLS